MKKLFLLFPLVLLVLFTSCTTKNAGGNLAKAPTVEGARLVVAPQKADLLAVYEYELENGLQVYLMPNSESPRFYAEIAVRTGSRNDPAETTGLAHYLEHLLFKGTDKIGTVNFEAEMPHLDRITELYEEHFREDDPEKRKAIYAQIDAEAQLAAQYSVPNEFQQIYQVLGGDALNAHTWLDETVYKIDLPANRMNQWAAIESERFRKPIFRGFHTELQIVYEEKNRSLDNKDRIIYEALNKALYQVHPYGQQTTLGTTEHLRRPSLVTIQKYYDTYYVPNNMAIIISGDIDLTETMKAIVENFGGFETKPLPEEKIWNEPELNTVRRVEVTYPGEEQVALAFRTAPAKSEDRFALELIDMILDNKTAGLINLNINLPQRAQSAGAYPQINNDYGSQTLWGIPKEGQTLEEVEALLLEQLNNIKTGNFEAELIPSIVNDFRKTRQLELESNEARVERLRDVYLSKRSWTTARNDLDQYTKISKDQIIEVANRYFSSGYVAAYRRDGAANYEAIEPPKITQISIEPGRESEFAKTILAMPTKQIEPKYVDFAKDVNRKTVSPAREYYHAANPVNQLFTFSVVVEMGTNHDPRLDLLASLMNKAGTGNLSSEEFKKALYRLGTDFSYGAADNQTVVTMSGLDDEFEPSLKLLQEFLASPKPEPGTLETLVQTTLTQREDAQKDAPSVSRAASWYSRYGENSPFREQLSNTELKAVTEGELLALHNQLFQHQQVIAYVGPRSLSQVTGVVENLLPAPKNPEPTPARRVRPMRNTTENEILFVELDKVQTQVRIESNEPGIEQAPVVPAMVFNEYFGGGMSGLVFQEIRESRALAYSAGAAYVLSNEPGDVSLMIQVAGTQAEQTNQALNAMNDLFQNMPREEGRFDQALTALENRFRTDRVGFRSLIASVRNWERLGFTEDPNKAWFAGIQTLTWDEFQTFYETQIKQGPWRVTIVGNKERIGELDLEKTTPLRSVDVKDIFPKE